MGLTYTCYMKRTHAYLPATLDAVTALGAQIGAARRELGWTAAELAGRLGVHPQLIGTIERGAPSTAIGTVLEAAVLVGVPLFGADPAELHRVAESERTRLALLPQRVRPTSVEISNDF